MVAFRRRLDPGAAAGKAVDERLELAGVHHALGVAVGLVADDHQRHVLRSTAAAVSRQRALAALRHEHLVLQAPRLVETLAAVDAVDDDEQVACNASQRKPRLSQTNRSTLCVTARCC